jgi:outer membrane protein OmpA-like peptidoglycan-associated protein
MRASLTMIVLGVLTLGPVTSLAEAQFIKRVQVRVKQKVTERKAETEESLLTHSTEPADSVLHRVAQPVDSLAGRAGASAGSAIANLGRSGDAEASARISQALASGRVDLAGVGFEADGSALTPGSERELRALAGALVSSPGSYLVQGRSDPGTAAAQPSGENRAAMVKHWLAAHGVPADHLFAAGDGAGQPDKPVISVVRIQ